MIRFWIFQSNTVYVHKYIYWRVEYSVNRSVIVVGITLIWRKAVVTIRTYKCTIAMKLYWHYLNLAGGQK